LGLLSFQLQAQSFPSNGLFQCLDGNEESICDQSIKFITSAGRLRAIRVEYVGWCGSMGPYTYYCENNICEDAGLKFEFKSEKNYFWTNKQYGFHCYFGEKDIVN